MSIHDGHRDRLKKVFREGGLDSFNEVQVLEMLLFYSNPRLDTNPIAHALLEHFGSLYHVLDASAEELEKVKGIGENASTLLTLIKPVYRFSERQREEQKVMRSIKACADYLVHCFEGRRNETVFMLCLDAKCKFLGCRNLGEGSVNSANVPIRRIVENALNMNAATVILAHNHPSGLALPSGEDVQATFSVAQVLSTVDIILADHIVVADGDYVSLVQSGYYSPDKVGKD